MSRISRHRHIVYLGIPDFYASIEELRRPEWAGRPLALAVPGPQAVIQGINEIARSEGIREGMPLSRAVRLCGKLIVAPPDPHSYNERHQYIVEQFERFSPLVEGTHPGCYFVDISGTQRLWGHPTDISCRMERRLAHAVGLHAKVGLAPNKLVSRVAAGCIPVGDLGCVFPGGEASFLAPLPVSLLPGVGPVTVSRLDDFNVRLIGHLAVLPPDSLTAVFGTLGRRLSTIARGVDPSPVFPCRKAPCIRIDRELQRDEIDRERLEAVLFEQTEEAGRRFRRRNRHPGQFAVEVVYADGVHAKAKQRIDPSTVRVDWILFGVVLEAFDRLVRRRVAIRRISLEFSDLVMPFRQLSLFPWEDTATVRGGEDLQRALDGIRSRFGSRAVRWGKSALL